MGGTDDLGWQQPVVVTSLKSYNITSFAVCANTFDPVPSDIIRHTPRRSEDAGWPKSKSSWNFCNSGHRDSVMECGSPLPLFDEATQSDTAWENIEQPTLNSEHRMLRRTFQGDFPISAFGVRRSMLGVRCFTQTRISCAPPGASHSAQKNIYFFSPFYPGQGRLT
jgi:hypothetical protein